MYVFTVDSLGHGFTDTVFKGIMDSSDRTVVRYDLAIAHRSIIASHVRVLEQEGEYALISPNNNINQF